MNAVEKILARASGTAAVRAGDIVYPIPDFVMIHDGVITGAKEELDALGIDRLFDPERVMMVTDHDVVYQNERAVARGAFNRKAARSWGVSRFFDAGQGGHGHIFPTERGLLLPGMFYFDNDRHCTNAGGVGALALRVGAEISRVLATGTTWTLVPQTMRVNIRGRMRPGVYGRDLGFHIGKLLRERDAEVDYRILEFAGELDQFSLAQRIALCSTPTEMRAIGVFFPPSEAVLEYARARATRAYTPVYPDADAKYESELDIDVGALEPQVALPGGPHKAANLSQVAGTRVDHAFIGSCGSGTFEDLEIAASILKDRRVAQGVRLLVVPGSEDSTKRLHREGLLDVFQQAGAFVLPAGCGPCASGRMGLLHSGEVSIATAVGNATGRFGAKDADIYLGSPATVATSAVTGEITDPRHFLQH
ncbi:MAG TPA: aconitase family protein [Burkholderiales bacterium]|nr:aconitase family protein [Burkholderiales bacterium]